MNFSEVDDPIEIVIAERGDIASEVERNEDSAVDDAHDEEEVDHVPEEEEVHISVDISRQYEELLV